MSPCRGIFSFDIHIALHLAAMSRRRTRVFPYSMDFLSSGTTPVKKAHVLLLKMAHAFEQIDREMLYEMQEDITRYLQPSDERHPEVWSSSRFSDTQVNKDRGVEDIKQSASHTLSETETLNYLANTTCLTAWSWVYQVLLTSQGPSNQYAHVPWSQAKSRANKILNFGRAVLEIYESEACQILIETGHEDVGIGVELKLRALLSFDDIYGRATFEETKACHELRHHEFVFSFSDFLSLKRDFNLSKEEWTARTHQDVSLRLAWSKFPLPI